MKLNTLEKLYLALRDLQPAIDVPEDTRLAALKPLERMLAKDLVLPELRKILSTACLVAIGVWGCSSDSAPIRAKMVDAALVDMAMPDARLPTGGQPVAVGMVAPMPMPPTRAEKCAAVCERVGVCAGDVCRGDGSDIDAQAIRQVCIDDCIDNQSLSGYLLTGCAGRPFAGLAGRRHP